MQDFGDDFERMEENVALLEYVCAKPPGQGARVVGHSFTAPLDSAACRNTFFR